jgi:hypothetical protein
MNFSKTFQIGTAITTVSIFSFFELSGIFHDRRLHIHQEIIVPMILPAGQMHVGYAGNSLTRFPDNWGVGVHKYYIPPTISLGLPS